MLINKYPVGWKDELHANLRDLDGNVYVLVDGVHNESFYRQLKNFGCFRNVPLYSTAPAADDETLGLGPTLVQYTAEHRKQWDALIELTNGLPALSVIVSPETIEQLAERLIPWCVVDADGYTLALSFADTRVLPALVSTLSEEQRGQFLGPALMWSYPGRDAQWLALPVTPLQARSPSSMVVLTAQQVAALMTASEADSIAYQLSQYVSKPLRGYAPFETHAMITQWLTLADELKIEGSQDRFDLCEFGVQRPAVLKDERYLTLLKSGFTLRTVGETLALFEEDYNKMSTI